MTMSSVGPTMGMGPWAFIVMWAGMMVGMMFPASAPMILTFSTIRARKRSAARPYVPVSVFTASYMLAWVAFGVVALSFAAGVDALAERYDWLTSNWSSRRPRPGQILSDPSLASLSPRPHGKPAMQASHLTVFG